MSERVSELHEAHRAAMFHDLARPVALRVGHAERQRALVRGWSAEAEAADAERNYARGDYLRLWVTEAVNG
jgi:hypothetical protein